MMTILLSSCFVLSLNLAISETLDVLMHFVDCLICIAHKFFFIRAWNLFGNICHDHLFVSAFVKMFKIVQIK